MKQVMIGGVVLLFSLSCHSVSNEEKPFAGDTNTFSEKIARGFPTRWGKLEIHTPWGSKYKVKGPNEVVEEFDLASYRTPLESKIVSRRWEGNGGMYLANEEFLSGFCFFADLVRSGFPVAHFPSLEWVTIREAYWYSRYMLSYVQAQAHMGISMIHGPYWTLKATEMHRKNRFIRDRGERTPSNKDVLLGVFVPTYSRRTGWPRVFEDANPTMLDYKSGDPHFLADLPTTDTFADPQGDKVYGWGIPSYLIDWRHMRWSHDSMDTTINLGTVSQTMKKKLVWTRCFFKSNHDGDAPGDPSRTVELLGSSAGEGFRGLALTLGSLNGLLEIKASLVADEQGNLGGINPLTYDPSRGLRYFPHEVTPELIMVGDLPERPNGYHPSDLSSQIWDQASLLWTTSDYYEQCFQFQKTPDAEAAVFSVDPPADGGLVEQRTYRVALGLSNMIVMNLQAMHRTPSGVLASTWTPEGRVGDSVSVQDSAMVIIALNEFDQRLQSNDRDPSPALRRRAREMIKSQADFLVTVQGADGSFHEQYRISSRAALGKDTNMRTQFFGIRALLGAWHATGNDVYLQRAKRTWNLLNTEYWHEPTGLYRSELGKDVVFYTPMDLGAAFGAIREMILASPAHRARPLLERFVRFWVQSMNNSGMQMSEDHNTGEITFGHGSGDDDKDGIPFMTFSDGPHGVAPVPAGLVAINIGGANNPQYASVAGDEHRPASAVASSYVPHTDSSNIVLPEKEPVDDSYVQRTTVERWMGWKARLSPSRKIKIGSDLPGETIFRRNCMACHGQRGEGIFGFSLDKDMFEYTKEAIVKTVTEGRFFKGMPTWGQGTDDLNILETDDELVLGNVLSEEEIDRVVDFLKTGLAEKYRNTKNWEAFRSHMASNRTTEGGSK